MKPTTACKQCRTAKRKRRVADDETGCSACRLRGQECSAARSGMHWQTVLSPPPVPELNATSRKLGAQLPYQCRMELVDHYFTFIHDRPQILFHESTLKDQVRAGDIDEALLFAICSLGCRFSRDSALRCLESSLSKASKRLLHANYERISLQSIQTCILLANLSAANLDINCEALYFGASFCTKA
jgi:hypothetical protein